MRGLKLLVLLLLLTANTLMARGTFRLVGDQAVADIDVNIAYDCNRGPAFWEMFWEDVNNHLCNATNGRVVLGRVNVYLNNSAIDADVVILETFNSANAVSGGFLGVDTRVPNPTIGGVRYANARITLGLPVIMNVGPNVVAHEMGHYFFAMLDEYEGYYWESEADYLASPNILTKPYRANHLDYYCLRDTATTASGASLGSLTSCWINSNTPYLMGVTMGPSTRWEDDPVNGGSRVSELCFPGTHRGPASDEDMDNDGDNDYRMLEHNICPAATNESTWETLKRIMELWNPALTIDVPTALDTVLPGNCGTIDFRFYSEGNSVVLTLDVSGSMNGRKLDLAKAAGNMYLEMFENITRDGERVGLVSYNRTASEIYPLTEVDATNRATVVDDIIDSINGLSAGGLTSIGDALRQSIQTVKSLPKAGLQSILLFSDGLNTASPIPADYYDELRDEGIIVNTIAFGADADQGLMKKIADTTGGVYHYVSEVADLNHIFDNVLAQTNGENMLMTTNGHVLAQQSRSHDVRVDDYSQTARFTTYYSGSNAPVFYLTKPDGSTIDSNSTTGVRFISGPGYVSYYVENSQLEAGIWSTTVQNTASSNVNYTQSVYVNDDGQAIKMAVVAQEERVELTEPIVIKAALVCKSNIANANLTARMFDPLGNMVEEKQLLDDGNNGDLYANDGEYTNSFSQYTRAGTYKVVVKGVAQNGIAHIAFEGPGQSKPDSPIEYVEQTFERIGQVSVVVGDPHVGREIIEIGDCQLLNGGIGVQAMNGPFNVQLQAGDKVFVTADGQEYAVPITQIGSQHWAGFWQYLYQGAGKEYGSCSIIRNDDNSTAGFTCDGECLNAIEMGDQTSATLNTTGEVWYKVTKMISGWSASEMQGRTIRVNGIEVQPGEFPLPPSENGVYYFQFTAGDAPWAGWVFW